MHQKGVDDGEKRYLYLTNSSIEDPTLPYYVALSLLLLLALGSSTKYDLDVLDCQDKRDHDAN